MPTNRLIFAVPAFLLFITFPAFADTNSTLPYYLNPLPSSQGVNDYVNTLFGKLDQATTQMAGSNAPAVNNATNAVKTIITTGVDFFGAVKYLVAALLGLIIPKVFGVNVPPLVFPVTELIMMGLIAFAVWRHLWKIFFLALVIMIIVILVFLAGGVLIH